jgi:hypothetical protein
MTATAIDGTVESAEVAPTGTSSDPTIRQRWRRYRVIVAVAAFGVVAAIVVAVLSSGANNGDLDPRSYRPDGTHALSALLGQRGVSVETRTTVSSAVSQAGADTTLVVSHPERLDDAALSQVAATPADLLVLEAGPLELGGLDLGVAPGGDASGEPTSSVQPACSLPAAVAAGSVSTGYFAYRVPADGTGCYPLVDGYALVTFTRDGRRVTLVGDATPFTNGKISDDGNAALALGLLSTHPKVVWLAPAIAGASASTGQSSLTDLLPERLKWAVLQLAIAVVLLALWRGRRLGRLVPEALPVVVRQAEAVVGKARLYRRAQARGRAADALRASTRSTLATRLGVLRASPTSSEKAQLVDAVAGRVGRDAHGLEALLYGSAPADDRELVSLAQRLAELEREVVG